ncbi:MAG: hypothetical protein ACYDBS_03240, partial [Acidimicrobiales bacterium]
VEVLVVLAVVGAAEVVGCEALARRLDRDNMEESWEPPQAVVVKATAHRATSAARIELRPNTSARLPMVLA